MPFFGASVYDDPAVYAKSSAIDFIHKVKTPTLVVVGDRDGECPAPQSFEFWHALRAEGVKTQLVVYPNEGHAFRAPGASARCAGARARLVRNPDAGELKDTPTRQPKRARRAASKKRLTICFRDFALYTLKPREFQRCGETVQLVFRLNGEVQCVGLLL